MITNPSWTPEVAGLVRAATGELVTRRPLTRHVEHRLHGGDGHDLGALDVFTADGLEALVAVTIASDALSLCTVVAFAPPTSELPHLSFEAVAGRGSTWVSVDLVPRVACADNPRYVDYVYEPLSELLWQMHERDDARQTQIRARHRMLLSPWLLSLRIEPTAQTAAEAAVAAYVRRFADLLDLGMAPFARTGLAPEQLAIRDRRDRDRIYSWEATSNYRFIEMLTGPGSVDLVQRTLRDPLGSSLARVDEPSASARAGSSHSH